MIKNKIQQHLISSGKFLVIGKDSTEIINKILNMNNNGSVVFENINTLSYRAQQNFYDLLRVPFKVVIGTIEKSINLPNIIKQKCMILKNEKFI